MWVRGNELRPPPELARDPQSHKEATPAGRPHCACAPGEILPKLSAPPALRTGDPRPSSLTHPRNKCGRPYGTTTFLERARRDSPPTASPLCGSCREVPPQSEVTRDPQSHKEATPAGRPHCACAPGEIRTPNHLIRSQMIYPLSYGRPATKADEESSRSGPHRLNRVGLRSNLPRIGVPCTPRQVLLRALHAKTWEIVHGGAAVGQFSGTAGGRPSGRPIHRYGSRLPWPVIRPRPPSPGCRHARASRPRRPRPCRCGPAR